MVSSSEGEESDGEIVLNSISDTDLPSVFVSNNDALTLTAHRLAMIGRARRRHRQVYQISSQYFFFFFIELFPCLMQNIIYLNFMRWVIPFVFSTYDLIFYLL